jgi:histidinol phosphatase-like PHP family hydrolase
MIDLHMHSTCSDGKDSIEQLIENVKNTGISHFSITDHDTAKACREVLSSQELKDKIKPFDYIIPNDNLMNAMVENSKALEDAVIVLTSLGLTKNDATKKAKEVMSKTDTAEQIVAKVLHDMGG